MKEIIEHIDKKEAILRTAEKLFSEQDFDAVSVRDIAKEANVNIAMISYYFGSKEKLFEAIILSRIELSQLTVKTIATDEIMTSWEKLMAVVDFYTDRLMNNRNVHKMINRELTINSRPVLRDLLINKITVNKEYLKMMMTEGIARGEFRAEADAEMMMMNLFGMLQYIVGSPHYSCRMLDQSTEEDLFRPEFRERTKNYFKDLFKKYLLINP